MKYDFSSVCLLFDADSLLQLIFFMINTLNFVNNSLFSEEYSGEFVWNTTDVRYLREDNWAFELVFKVFDKFNRSAASRMNAMFCLCEKKSQCDMDNFQNNGKSVNALLLVI